MCCRSLRDIVEGLDMPTLGKKKDLLCGEYNGDEHFTE
jgi:hypothetical protein